MTNFYCLFSFYIDICLTITAKVHTHYILMRAETVTTATNPSLATATNSSTVVLLPLMAKTHNSINTAVGNPIVSKLEFILTESHISIACLSSDFKSDSLLLICQTIKLSNIYQYLIRMVW